MLERVDDVVLVDELVARVEAQDHRHHRQREQHAVGGLHVRSESVGAAQDGDHRVRVLLRELGHGGLGLKDVALDRRARRVRSAHLLGEEGRVVLLGAVEVRRRLEDELAHARVRPAAGGEDVHRPDHVVLVGLAGRGRERVGHEARVHHRVDLRRFDDPAQQRVLRAHADELGALEFARGVLGVHADDHLDFRV